MHSHIKGNTAYVHVLYMYLKADSVTSSVLVYVLPCGRREGKGESPFYEPLY